MKVLIIHNPVSGLGTGDVYEFIRQAAHPGDEFVMRITADGTDMGALARDAGAFDAVVASGGDGTVSQVAYALRGSGTPLLAFPSGTANLLVNNLGNATEASALARTLRTGRVARIDLGEMAYRDEKDTLKRQGFLLMAGAGYDAEIMRDSKEHKHQFGQLSYYMSALGNPRPTYSHFKMTLDGKPVEADGICVLVGNWGSVGPAFRLIPGSDPVDGLLDVAVVSLPHAARLIAPVIGSLFSGGKGVEDPDIEVYHVKSMELECSPALPMQFDGENLRGSHTTLSARIVPGGVLTLVDELSPLYERAEPRHSK